MKDTNKGTSLFISDRTGKVSVCFCSHKSKDIATNCSVKQCSRVVGFFDVSEEQQVFQYH